MSASAGRKRGGTRAPTRAAASGRSRSSETRLRRPRLPDGIGNIIGVILLVIAAFVAGYLIGRAGPPVLAMGNVSQLTGILAMS